MATKRSATVYGLLAAAWALIATWQVVEHSHTQEFARTALLNRARDISNSVSVVIRSQGRFGGFVSRGRIEAALEELTKSKELLGVALLNASYDVAAAAGKTIDLNADDFTETHELWTDKTVTVVNLVDLGPESQEGDMRPSTIVMPSPEDTADGETDGERRAPIPPGAPIDEERMEMIRSITADEPITDTQVEAIQFLLTVRPFDDETAESIRSLNAGDSVSEEQVRLLRGVARGFRPGDGRAGDGRGGDGRRGRGTGGGRGGQFFGRPPWMSEDQYVNLVEKQGVHAFVLSMSTSALHSEAARDLWLRIAVAAIALVAAIGVGVAWQGLEQSAELQLRLMRAREMNLHLQEMNVAAAGLAHETRNPLNIIRGLAQMISRHDDADTQIQERSREITREVDRVTGRLNQFMDYSKPPDARPAPINLKSVVGDVASALESDRDDKQIEFEMTGLDLTVEADESLLRQVLFNLLLNSIQAVDTGGKIEVAIEKTGPGEAAINVTDDGPGVPPEDRDEIFRPYFTTSEDGTGLGLAVVRQIVLAHQWDIACVSNDGGGAVFRITGLKVS
jgi:signal transduction histidine kinase